MLLGLLVVVQCVVVAVMLNHLFQRQRQRQRNNIWLAIQLLDCDGGLVEKGGWDLGLPNGPLLPLLQRGLLHALVALVLRLVALVLRLS